MKKFSELYLMIKTKVLNKLFPKGTKLPCLGAKKDMLKVIEIPIKTKGEAQIIAQNV